MKMDEHCKEIENALEIDKRIRKSKIRVVKTWVEGWENKVLGPSGDEVFEARSAIMVDSSGLIQINVSILQHIPISCILRRSAGTTSTGFLESWMDSTILLMRTT